MGLALLVGVEFIYADVFSCIYCVVWNFCMFSVRPQLLKPKGFCLAFLLGGGERRTPPRPGLFGLSGDQGCKEMQGQEKSQLILWHMILPSSIVSYPRVWCITNTISVGW